MTFQSENRLHHYAAFECTALDERWPSLFSSTTGIVIRYVIYKIEQSDHSLQLKKLSTSTMSKSFDGLKIII